MKSWKFTKGDFFGGLTAGVVALPLALAFGIQSGLGAEAGLYGAIFLGFFAAAFGGTPSQISGPTGPMTVVTAATVSAFVAQTGNVDQAIGPLIACFVLAGILQIVMGICRIGSLIKFIPYPVTSGFMSGIGCIIILLQIFPALGTASPEKIVDVVKTLPAAIRQTNFYALGYAVATITIIYLFPKITKAVPSTLIALIAVTLCSVFLKLDVPVIGDIPQGFPKIRLGELGDINPSFFSTILIAAITLAALGSIDSLLTSVIADNVTKTKHKSNKELIGQGIGNAVGGLFAGIPGAGATMRTLVNVRSGGRNRISGVIHAIVLLVILLGVGKYAALIPKSVLAGILITVGIGILDYKGIGHLTRVPRADAIIMIIVLLITVFLDLITAVAIGMVLASLLFMKKMSQITEENIRITELRKYGEEMNWSDEYMPAYMQDNVIIKHLDGPLFFGFAAGFQERINKLANIRYIIIRMEKVPFIDQTGLYALEEAILSLEQRNINVLFTGLKKQPYDMLRKVRMIPNIISEDNIYADFKDAVHWLASNRIEELA